MATKFPDKLDNAVVLEFSDFGDFGTIEGDGRTVWYFAICQYPNDTSSKHNQCSITFCDMELETGLFNKNLISITDKKWKLILASTSASFPLNSLHLPSPALTRR